MKIEQLVRPNILKLKPYSSAREEFTGKAGVFLDANENPYGSYNRYPDPYQRKLKQRIAVLKSVSEENIFLGNGSDEAIDLCFRIFCRPGRDKALCFYPSYGMYEVSAAVNDVTLIQLPLNADFQIDQQALKPYLTDPELKLIFICSPNNPTGNSLDGLEQILETFSGMVIVDEAYIDFSSRLSLLHKLSSYPNLIVLQTLSKAFGLAALRIGMAFASEEVLRYFNKVKPPYNISQQNQEMALELLQQEENFRLMVTQLLQQRENLIDALTAIQPLVQQVYPSDANFLLVRMRNAGRVYETLVNRGIITRNRSAQIPDTLRITVGTAQENQQLLEALKQLNDEKDFIY